MSSSPALLSAFAFVGLAGCAAPHGVYRDPPDKAGHSRIDLTNSSSFILTLTLYDEPLSCSRPVLFEKDVGVAIGGARTLYAKKGVPFTIGAWYLTDWKFGGPAFSRRECYMTATFVPTGDAYRFEYASNSGLQTCGVLALESNGAKWRGVKSDFLVLRPFNLAFAQPGPWCAPLSESQRTSLVAP